MPKSSALLTAYEISMVKLVTNRTEVHLKLSIGKLIMKITLDSYLIIDPFHMLRVIWIKSHSRVNLEIIST